MRQAELPCDGEVWLQTFPRVFGFVFNPVNFWYCKNKAGELIAVLAEVNNTFGESHRYLLFEPQGAVISPDKPCVCKKVFHVSPFCEVQGDYQFYFSDDAHTNLVKLDYYDNQGLVLKTAISGQFKPLDGGNLRRNLYRFPLLALKVFVGIHWEALILWLKKVPFFSKPQPPSSLISFVKNQKTSQQSATNKDNK